jgi:hypothetical protein
MLANEWPLTHLIIPPTANGFPKIFQRSLDLQVTLGHLVGLGAHCSPGDQVIKNMLWSVHFKISFPCRI